MSLLFVDLIYPPHLSVERESFLRREFLNQNVDFDAKLSGKLPNEQILKISDNVK